MTNFTYTLCALLLLSYRAAGFVDRGWSGALTEEARAAYLERASEVLSASDRQGASPPRNSSTDDEDALIRQALPSCSVLFFHHVEKTAGTTLRSVLQRQAQLGQFDFVSFVNRYGKVQLQIVLHQLDTLLREGRLEGVRLAVEIHLGGGGYPTFVAHPLPDLLLLRSKLRAAGCKCNLVTLLRHPLLHHLSWHAHFVNHRVPLCFWSNPPDCQARTALALACHGGHKVKPLSRARGAEYGN